MPPRTMASRGECAFLAAGGAGKDVRGRAHASADEHRLPERLQIVRQAGMIGAEGARRAFAVDIELTGFAAVDMRLNLARIVRNVEKQRKLRVREELRKNAPCEVPDDLAICERTIDCASHCAKITLSQIGMLSARRQARGREEASLPPPHQSPFRA